MGQMENEVSQTAGVANHRHVSEIQSQVIQSQSSYQMKTAVRQIPREDQEKCYLADFSPNCRILSK